MSQLHEHDHIDDHEDPDGMSTWAIGVGGAFLMISTVAIACGIYYNAATTESINKSVNIRYEQRDMVRAAQHAVIEEAAHWERVQDPITGDTVDRLVIPIDTAIDIVAGRTK